MEKLQNPRTKPAENSSRNILADMPFWSDRFAPYTDRTDHAKRMPLHGGFLKMSYFGVK